MTNSIEAAIASAEAQANKAPVILENSANAVAVVDNSPTRLLTTADIIGSGFAPDHYISFTKDGTMLVGAPPTPTTPPIQHKSLKLLLDLSTIGVGHGFRVTQGTSYSYSRTINGKTTEKGENWHEALARAQKMDPRCQPYNSWQLPFTLLEDIEGHKAGEKLGYSTVYSSFLTFKPFWMDVVAKYGERAIVELTLTCSIAVKGDNRWGVPAFTLIGELDQN